MRPVRLGLAGLILIGISAGLVQAQSWSTSSCKDEEGSSGSHWFWGSSESVCELRTIVLPRGVSSIEVRGENGGIDVIGEDRDNIVVEARVVASASSQDAAKDLEGKVKVLTGGLGGAEVTIHDDGPRLSGWFKSGGYSVSYRLKVPRHLSVDLQTANGGVDLKHVEGTLKAETTNGGLTLEDLAGEVHAETVNGAIALALSGDRWRGSGLKAETVNGAVHVTVSKQYSAHLKASTVNGGISVGFPITVEGKLKDSVDTQLGQGGATISLQTVNGAISIDK